MEDHSDRRSVSSRPGVGRSQSFSTFYMPSKVETKYESVEDLDC